MNDTSVERGGSWSSTWQEFCLDPMPFCMSIEGTSKTEVLQLPSAIHVFLGKVKKKGNER